MYSSAYFAPSYFPASYFLTGSTQTVVPPPPPPLVSGYCDRDAFAAINAALAATGEFAEVRFGSPRQVAVGADGWPLAVITPEEWTENDLDPASPVRHVAFRLSLSVRGIDPLERFERLDRLTSVVQNAVNGSDLGGGCLRAQTRIRRGLYDPKSRHPEQGVVLTGGFSYLVPSTTAHDASA